MPSALAATRATANDTARIAFAPKFDLFDVPSSSSIRRSIRRCSVTTAPAISGPILSLILATACNTPLPPYRLGSPSLSSTASFSPVDAPEGTSAEPVVPSSRTTLASTVGLPRESNTSAAPILRIRIVVYPPSAHERFERSSKRRPVIPCPRETPTKHRRPLKYARCVRQHLLALLLTRNHRLQRSWSRGPTAPARGPSQ